MFVVSVRERGKEEHKFTFRKTKISIGRLRANDIILPKRNISKKHAELVVAADNSVVLLDMGSTNGTFLNGKRVLEQSPVRPEDKLFLGDYLLQVEVVPDKSAIEGAAILGTSPAQLAVSGVATAGDELKPTASEIDTDLLEAEMRRLGLAAADNSGPATVVVDPLQVPSAPPPDTVEPRAADEVLGAASDALAGDLQPRAARATPEMGDAATLKMKRVEAPQTTEDEDLLDIPLLEEAEALESAPVAPAAPAAPVRRPAPTPVTGMQVRPAAAPAPKAEAARVEQPGQPVAPAVERTPTSTTQQVRFFAPADGRQRTLADVLNAHYPRIEAEFESFVAASRGVFSESKALDIVSRVVSEVASGFVSGQALADLARQVLAELTGLGAVAGLLENAKVGEVFVNPTGRMVAYDWRGGIVDTNTSLSCGAAVARVAGRILRQNGESEAEGFVQTRLEDGTVVRILKAPYAAQGAGLRFVRPFRTDISLAKLKDTGLASDDQIAKMRQAVGAGRSVLVLGRETETNSIVVCALASTVPEDRKVMAAGDRFAGGGADRRWMLVAPEALSDERLLRACAGMGCHWLVADDLPGSALPVLLKAAAVYQIPFVASVRTFSAAGLPALLAAAGGTTGADLLEVVEPLVVTTRRGDDRSGRVDGVAQFNRQADGKLKLTPAAG